MPISPPSGSKQSSMAAPFPPKLLLPFSLSFFYLLHLSFSTTPFNPADIHDLLPSYNLPIGLLPNNIKSYSLSRDNSTFTIELTHPCYVHFRDQIAYYRVQIGGKLSYGKVSEVFGIQAKKLFIWISVTGIDVDEKSNMIEFHAAGGFSQRLPAEEFRTIPTCRNKGCEQLASA